MRRLALLLAAATFAACGEDPPPTGTPARDGGVASLDVGFFEPDSGEAPDSGEVPDAEARPDAAADAGPMDATAGDDAAVDGGGSPDAAAPDAAEDAGPGPDAAVDGGPMTPDAAVDAGGMDAGFMDAMVDAGPPDSGILPDADNDGISDLDEGNGAVDTDNDGTPDSMDTDSDNDGIPDAVEAGDADPATPPIDTDNDGTPDFQDTDADGDGIDDVLETTADPDNDGIPNYLDLDSDGDFIADLHEGALDADNDTVPNFLDDDSDGDGISDAIEAGDQLVSSPPRDNDFDSVPNFLDEDSDNDFISDAVEGAVDTDNDTILDYLDIDSDNDSILDRFEAGDQDLLTPPLDTDNDNTPDFRDTDSDGDTISDVQEGTVDTNADGTPDRIDTDSDGDGWSDAAEAGDTDLLTPPVDTESDGTPDFRDLDSDGDGLADAVELGCPAGSDRLLVDTDADTFDDLAEVAYGSDPCNAGNIIDDFYFVLPPNGPGANAPLQFTDTQIDRMDLAINIDTTGSMAGEIANLRSSLSTTIIPQVGMVIPDSAFAVSSYEDYPQRPFGNPGSNDLPFRLGTRVTTNAGTAQTAVNGLQTRNGWDFPESGHDALFKVATGNAITWPGGSIPAFDPAINEVPGVADGAIGGVGFRQDALPVVLHITDALSHTDRDYAGQGFSSPTADDTRLALSAIGARVVTISNGRTAAGSVYEPFVDMLCSGRLSTFFGGIDPVGADVDWYELQGASAGDTVDVDVTGTFMSYEFLAGIAVANATGIITDVQADGSNRNVDISGATLTGTGPFYVAVTGAGDTDYNGSGGTSSGGYLMNVSVNGAAVFPSPTACRADDANQRMGATPLVPPASVQLPPDPVQCQADCDNYLGGLHPIFADFTFPYEIAQETGAVIPPCAWSFFGGSRPAGCAAGQCCTGVGGAGSPPDLNGNCPLAFEVDETGAGLGAAAVAGVEALVNFAAFTITTVVRPDPAQLPGLDTSCFIHGVVPVTATPPNTCAPSPVAVDLLPPVGLDSWQNVVPGTVLDFQVDALNEAQGTSNPCVPSATVPQQFTAYIDVVADGVTVVDTRQVIIIVPPTTPGGAN